MFSQLQRLATIDDDVADVVLIDVVSVLAVVPDVDAVSALVHQTDVACARGGRELICAVAPITSFVAERTALRELVARIRERQLRLIYSKNEPLPSLAFDAVPSGRQVTLVLGTVTETTTWCLAPRAGSSRRPIASILDISTGQLHIAARNAPEVVARAEAVLRHVTSHYKTNYKEPVSRQLGAGVQVVAERHDYLENLAAKASLAPGPALPQWFTTPWLNSHSKSKGKDDFINAIDTEELDLLGWKHSSRLAREALAAVVKAIPGPRLDTGYICADVRRGINTWRLERITCRLQDEWRSATGTGIAALLRNLFSEFPTRWFGPRIIDLFAWMIGQGLPLPARGADPAWSAFVLDPEQDSKKPIDLAAFSARVLALGPRDRAWLGDLRREAPGPTSVDSTARCLPSLDVRLGQEAGGQLRALLSHDIEPTMPVLAAIERRGVSLHAPADSTWGIFDAARRDALEQTSAEARSILRANIDIFRRPDLLVRALEKNVGKLTRIEQDGARIADVLDRYLEVFDGLDSIRRARTLGAFNQEAPLRRPVRARATSVHAVTGPQKNGRLKLTTPRLQSLPKRSPEGLVLRSALRARPGHLIIAFDYNAFEARLAADLSNDPVLIAASRRADLFHELAKVFFGAPSPSSTQRDLSKAGFYGILFGQRKDQFWKKHPDLPRGEADALFACAEQHLHGLLAYRDQVHAQIDKNWLVETRGGWCRRLHAKTKAGRRRHGFSALVQGLAADILRRVLRQLHVQLAPYDAGVIHHIHDELFVETPAAHVAKVKPIIRATMVGAPAAGAPVLLQAVQLVVKEPRIGESWSDLA